MNWLHYQWILQHLPPQNVNNSLIRTNFTAPLLVVTAIIVRVSLYTHIVLWVCYCFPLQIGWLLVEWDSPWTSYSVSYSLSHSQQWPVGTILQQHSLSHTHSILLLHCLDCSGTNGHSSPHSQTTNRAAVSASWDKKVITSSLNNQPSQDNVCIQWTLTIIPDTSSGAVKFVLINELFTFQMLQYPLVMQSVHSVTAL